MQLIAQIRQGEKTNEADTPKRGDESDDMKIFKKG